MNIQATIASMLLLATFGVAGCQSTDQARYASIDKTAKTVTMPAGNRGLLGRIKRELSENGWRFTFDRGPDRTVGTGGENVDVESFNTFRTRYRMFVEWNQIDYCFNLQPLIFYDVVVIDNNTGSEVVSLSGRECEGEAARQVISALSE